MIELKSMRISRISIWFLAALSILTGSLSAQTTETVSADMIVGNAVPRLKAYVETFKNLISEEKKTFEIFGKNGEVKKRRIIESTFLVYPLSKAEGYVAEFRNVLAVDGKKLERTDERARDFFERIIASESSQSELDHIRDESTRFDEDFAINGLTLFQAVALSEELRSVFRFSLVGKDVIAGKEVYVIQFDQVNADPAITVNSRGAPGRGASHNYDIEIDDDTAKLNARIRGRFWIDVSTFNIRRELRERTIRPAGYSEPLVVAEDKFEYTDSEFGILTPQRLTHLQYRVTIKSREARKDTRVTFDYGKFTRPDVEVKSAEVKENN